MIYQPGKEIHDLGTTEIETHYHNGKCCWLRTIGEAFSIIAIIVGFLLIMRLALIITGQLDANLI